MNSKRIAIMLPENLPALDRIRLGIYRYARPSHPWDFLNLGFGPRHYPMASHWRAHGVIGQAGRADLAALARGLRIPYVNLYGGRPFAGLAHVECSNAAIGALAAHYFLDLGFRNFGFVGLRGDPSSNDRHASYAQTLREARQTIRPMSYTFAYPPVSFEGEVTMEVETILHRYLAWLAKPVAIFCFDDRHAVMVSEACGHLKLRVPDDVAILGVSNDELACNKAYPPISSIKLPLESVGHRAAEVLDHLMAGRKAPARPVLLMPEGVVARQSTDILCVDDPRLAIAFSAIRKHTGERIRIHDIARLSGLNRRQLERRFREVLGRTPLQEIRRIQIDRVKERLRETFLTLDAIAAETGFGSRSRMTVEFTKAEGMPPAAYRKLFRHRA